MGNLNGWQLILHEIGTIIAGVAAVIAAVSSLRNGRTLNGNSKAKKVAGRKVKHSRNGKKTLSEDKDGEWYSPPIL